jgi:hypothetical protein
MWALTAKLKARGFETGEGESRAGVWGYASLGGQQWEAAYICLAASYLWPHGRREGGAKKAEGRGRGWRLPGRMVRHAGG